MVKRTNAVYAASADEAGLIVALLCLLLSLAPPLIVLVIPATGLELSRIDGLHRITGVCSACFSFCVLMVGYGFNHRRSVIVCSIAGSVLLAVACICGTGCCSAFLAWIQGEITASELPDGALFSSSAESSMGATDCSEFKSPSASMSLVDFQCSPCVMN